MAALTMSGPSYPVSPTAMNRSGLGTEPIAGEQTVSVHATWANKLLPLGPAVGFDGSASQRVQVPSAIGSTQYLYSRRVPGATKSVLRHCGPKFVIGSPDAHFVASQSP